MLDRFNLFTTTITELYKNLQRIKNREMAGFGLKGTHVMCLFRLKHNPEGLSLTQLSTSCSEDKAAMSRTVAELTELGYVTTSSDKKYRAPIILTQKGLEVSQKVDELVEAAVGAGGDGLTDEEREIFYKSTARISDNLKKYLAEDK